MEQLMEYNKKLLYNILPDHVAQHFLAQQAKKNDVSVKTTVGGYFIFDAFAYYVLTILSFGLNCIVVFCVTLRLCAPVGFSRAEFQAIST